MFKTHTNLKPLYRLHAKNTMYNASLKSSVLNHVMQQVCEKPLEAKLYSGSALVHIMREGRRGNLKKKRRWDGRESVSYKRIGETKRKQDWDMGSQ